MTKPMKLIEALVVAIEQWERVLEHRDIQVETLSARIKALKQENANHVKGKEALVRRVEEIERMNEILEKRAFEE